VLCSSIRSGGALHSSVSALRPVRSLDEICYPALLVRQVRNRLRTYDVIPEILEPPKRHGPTRTVDLRDEMVKVADEKNLVYNDKEVTRALTILKWRKLAINATRGFWCPTSEGSKHPRITPGQARELTTLRVLIAKEKARKP